MEEFDFFDEVRNMTEANKLSVVKTELDDAVIITTDYINPSGGDRDDRFRNHNLAIVRNRPDFLSPRFINSRSITVFFLSEDRNFSNCVLQIHEDGTEVVFVGKMPYEKGQDETISEFMLSCIGRSGYKNGKLWIMALPETHWFPDVSFISDLYRKMVVDKTEDFPAPTPEESTEELLYRLTEFLVRKNSLMPWFIEESYKHFCLLYSDLTPNEIRKVDELLNEEFERRVNLYLRLVLGHKAEDEISNLDFEYKWQPWLARIRNKRKYRLRRQELLMGMEHEKGEMSQILNSNIEKVSPLFRSLAVALTENIPDGERKSILIKFLVNNMIMSLIEPIMRENFMYRKPISAESDLSNDPNGIIAMLGGGSAIPRGIYDLFSIVGYVRHKRRDGIKVETDEADFRASYSSFPSKLLYLTHGEGPEPANYIDRIPYGKDMRIKDGELYNITKVDEGYKFICKKEYDGHQVPLWEAIFPIFKIGKFEEFLKLTPQEQLAYLKGFNPSFKIPMEGQK